MKLKLPRLLLAIFVAALSQSAIADKATPDIDPGASTAAHTFELATSYANGYVKLFYNADYDSEALKVEAAKLHDVLHEWDSGNATETEVAEQMLAVKAAWNTFRQTINSAGILNSGDYECDTLYQGIKDTYKELRLLLNNAR